MRELRSVGDNSVVLFGRNNGDAAEAYREEHLLYLVQQCYIRAAVGGQDHRSVVEQHAERAVKPPSLDARHRVSADEFKSVGFCKLVSGCKDISLYTGTVYDDRAFFDYVRLALKKFDR